MQVNHVTGTPSERETAGFATCLVDESHDALIALAVDGTILFWNRGAQNVLGYGADEAVGRVLEELLVLPQRREQSRGKRAEAVTLGAAAYETSWRRGDGTEVSVEVSLRKVVQDGGGFVALSAKAENPRVQQTQRLKSEFVANMSHELRSPLNTIIGFAELMFKGKVGPVSAPHKEYLGDILDSSRHLLRLINDVIELAKLESGKMAFRPEPLELAKVVGEVRDVLRGLATSKHIQVDTEIEPTIDKVTLDPSKLKQVLYNYLSNALKFTPEHGRVSIHAALEGANEFRLAVRDTGMGIAAEDQHRLFVEFQQLGVGAAKAYAGAGSGLALTKRIVEAQGGRVEVNSEPNVGSVFSVVLPVSAPEGAVSSTRCAP